MSATVSDWYQSDEPYERFLALARPPREVLSRWEEISSDGDLSTAAKVRAHASVTCTDSNLRHFLRGVALSKVLPYEPVLADVIRDRFGSQSDKGRVQALAMALSRGAEDWSGLMDAGRSYTEIVHFMRKRTSSRGRRRLVNLLGEGVESATWGITSEAPTKTPTPPDLHSSHAETTKRPSTSPSGQGQRHDPRDVDRRTLPKLPPKRKPPKAHHEPQLRVRSRAAAVVLNSDECLKLGEYLRVAGRASYDADSRFLASELSVHHRWTLVLEQQMAPCSISGGKPWSALTVTTTEAGIQLRTLLDTGVLNFGPTVLLSHSGASARRWARAESVQERLAAAILLYVFGTQRNMRTTASRDDTRRAAMWLDKQEQATSAVYRLTKPPAWGYISLRTNLTKPTPQKGARRPHDVRGFYRTVNGEKQRVRAHRRRS